MAEPMDAKGLAGELQASAKVGVGQPIGWPGRACELMERAADFLDALPGQERGDSPSQTIPVGQLDRAATREVELDVSDWEVEVRIAGERVLTLGHSHLSGIPDIDRYGDVVRNCAEHLMAFIGTGEPVPCFACGDTGQERWMGANGEEVGPCSVCGPTTWPCPVCGGNDDDRQLMCEACGGAGLLGELGDGGPIQPSTTDGDAVPGTRSNLPAPPPPGGEG